MLLESNLQFDRLSDPNVYLEQMDAQWTAATSAQPTAVMKESLHNNLARRLRFEVEHRGFYQGCYGYPVFGEVFVTNRYGANVAQTRITSDYNQADEAWWQETVARGTYVGDVTFDESAGMWAVNLAVRINDVTEHLVGVIRFVVSLKEVIAILDEIRQTAPHQTTHLALLTADSDVVYCTDAGYDPNALTERLACHTVMDTRDGPSDQAWFIYRGNASGTAFCEWVAHAHLAGHRNFEGLGWTVLVKHDAADVLAPVAQLRNSVLLPSAAISIAAVILGLLVVRSVAQPIQMLADAALQISRGDLDIDLAIESNGEIGHLASCFGQMSR